VLPYAHRQRLEAAAAFPNKIVSGDTIKKFQLVVATAMLLIATSFLALAQQPAQAPPRPMSFSSPAPVQVEPISAAWPALIKFAKRLRPLRKHEDFPHMSARGRTPSTREIVSETVLV
jgi:hypothetical protein